MFCTELDLNLKKKKCKNIEQMMTSCVSGACSVTKSLKYFRSPNIQIFSFQRGERRREPPGPGEVGPGGAAGSRHLSGVPGQPCGPGHFLQSKTTITTSVSGSNCLSSNLRFGLVEAW